MKQELQACQCDLQKSALEDALRQLYILGGIDRDGHITDLGRRMAALPVEPSVARTLIAAAELHCLPDALTVAAMLSAETIFSGNRHACNPLQTSCNRSASGYQNGTFLPYFVERHCAWPPQA